MERKDCRGPGSSGAAPVLIVVLFALIVAAAGCRDDHSLDPAGSGGPSGSLVSFTGCKTSAAFPSDEMDSSDSSCVAYRYDGDGNLFFEHIDAGFNCCQDRIYASISIDGATITVTEAEDPEGGLCDCLCLFDLCFVARDLEPGLWTIRFSEPYLGEGDEAIEFTVDLLLATEGEYCVPRKSYPWGL
jgi:hypothetical protein